MEIQVGAQRGHLTLVSPYVTQNKRSTSWICVCACGSERKVHRCQLQDGTAVSCGKCALRVRSRLKDYSGKKFGMLTALKYLGQREHLGKMQTWWSFKCDCTKEIERCLNVVLGYKDKSNCGCVTKERRAGTKISNNYAEKARSYRNHLFCAKKRGLESRLTQEQYIDIASKNCHYCNMVSLRKSRSLVYTDPVPFNSVDRKNNELYYDLTNSLPACFVCQKAKGSMKYDDYLAMCRSVSAHQDKVHNGRNS